MKNLQNLYYKTLVDYCFELKNGGVLKTSAVKNTFDLFMKNNIDTLADFEKEKDIIEKPFCAIKGLESGVAFDYLKMFVGDDNTIKYDRMIQRFIDDAVNNHLNKAKSTCC